MGFLDALAKNLHDDLNKRVRELLLDPKGAPIKWREERVTEMTADLVKTKGELSVCWLDCAPSEKSDAYERYAKIVRQMEGEYSI